MVLADIEVLPALHWSDEERAHYTATSRADTPEEAFRETALHPLRGRIWLIGIAFDLTMEPVVLRNREPETAAGTNALMADLRNLLLEHWNKSPTSRPPWVGWNCNDYDWPFLRAAAMSAGQHRLAAQIPHDKWGKSSHDLMLWAKGTGRRNYKLDEFARFLDIEGKLPSMDGSRVYDLYLAGEIDRAEQYVRQDVRMLQQIHPYFDWR